MKIPVLDSPKVEERPIGTPYVNTDGRTGLEDVAHGFEQVGAGVSAYEEATQKATQRTNAIGANDAVTLYQGDTGDELHGVSGGADAPDGADLKTKLDAAFASAQPGFLSTQGQEAAKASADVRERIDKRRMEIAESLPNEEQKQLFLRHSANIALQAHATIEEHVTRQNQVAEAASIEGRQDSALRAITNDYTNDAGAATLSAGAISAIRALSPEDGQAKVEAWNQKVASARLNMYIANKDWAGAEGLYAKSKDQLGVQAPQFERQIQTLRQDQQGETTAAQLIEQARDPENGRVDSTKVNALIDTVPVGPLRDEVRGRAEHRMAVEERAWTEKVNNVANLAISDYLNGGNSIYAITPSARDFLTAPKNGAAEQWRKIEMMSRADREHAQNQSPTLAQQTAMNNFQLLARDHPDQVATMKPEDFQANWMPQFAVRDRERAGALLAQMHGQANKPEKLPPIEERMLLQMGRDAGVFPPKVNDVSKWDSDDQARAYYAASQQLSEMGADYRKTHGKEPPADVVQGWVRDMFLKENPNAHWWQSSGTTRIQAQVAGQEFKPVWSDEDQAKAKDALKKAGAPRVDDAAVEAYLRRKNKLPSLPSKAKDVTQEAPAPDAPYVPPVNYISPKD